MKAILGLSLPFSLGGSSSSEDDEAHDINQDLGFNQDQ